MRELHSEKRNLIKKLQECEELKMNIKFYERKCDTYEMKLDEKENTIARLKTKLIQLETEVSRLEYECQKLKSAPSSIRQPFNK
jgi:chromosome segregation ATPase